MSKYAWTITRQNNAIFDPGELLGTIGPSDAADDIDWHTVPASSFMLYDDDGEFYCEGLITGDYNGFEPLDDFGYGGLGATEIRYRTPSGNWEVL